MPLNHFDARAHYAGELEHVDAGGERIRGVGRPARGRRCKIGALSRWQNGDGDLP
jgi:hypothetical protein